MRLADLTWLARYQQTYHKVIADPWACCQEVPHQPEFRALWLERFLHTIHQWHSQLKRRYSNFYLAIWLHEPTAEGFCHSRLMVAVAERSRYYESLFSDAQEMPLPLEYLTVPGIETLTWRAYPREALFTPDEYAQAASWVSNKPHTRGVSKQGKSCIRVQFGWEWVGQIPAPG
ncbi:hypothetical protein GCM10011378_41940 [Hymenobacter glacieicola]|uniref:DUF4130 domain-containing protein n=1 Tax=Hymenobacter glacieicola TaxID=1562124 RepID=A0ABQ1X6V9_9BACT|nr:hypothetical protein GCM10011378_41940 [Hymenobacter glacieicola]